jgi:hypothetical protein
MYALKALMTSLGSGTSTAARTMSALDPKLGRASLSLQPDHRRHRRGRRHPDRRLQPAQGSAGAQRPHPQALGAGISPVGVIGEQPT